MSSNVNPTSNRKNRNFHRHNGLKNTLTPNSIKPKNSSSFFQTSKRFKNTTYLAGKKDFLRTSRLQKTSKTPLGFKSPKKLCKTARIGEIKNLKMTGNRKNCRPGSISSKGKSNAFAGPGSISKAKANFTQVQGYNSRRYSGFDDTHLRSNEVKSKKAKKGNESNKEGRKQFFSKTQDIGTMNLSSK